MKMMVKNRFIMKIKKKKINRKLKQMGINTQNIIVQPKRTRIRENILNL